MSVPAMNCPRCGVQFRHDAQFCAGCGNNVELQRALCDFEHGDFDARISGLCAIARIEKPRLQEFASEVSGFLTKLKPHYAFQAAAALQKNGVEHPQVAEILLNNLARFLELESDDREKLLDAISTIHNNPDVTGLLKGWVQSSWSTKREMLCTLGAIGDLDTKSFLEYWAIRGEPEAIAALQLFGKAALKDVLALSERLGRKRR